MVDRNKGDITHSFSTTVLQPPISFTIESRQVTYSLIDKTSIYSIRKYVSDGKRPLVDLHGPETSFSTLIKLFLSSADVWSLMSSREFTFQLKDNLFTDTMVCVQFLPTCLNQWCKQLCKYYFQSCQTSRQTTTQIWNRACW